MNRCAWCLKDDLYQQYHDTEWGKQVKEDKILFEFLILESAQAGLSWYTILKRREAYREAFAHFDVDQVAQFDEQRVQQILDSSGVIKHRKKIESAVKNAKLFIQIQQEFGSFYNYLYGFLPGSQPILNQWENLSQVPATSEQSEALAKDLKKRGFSFLGPTICYAFMQATGMVNDHLMSCDFRN